MMGENPERTVSGWGEKKRGGVPKSWKGHVSEGDNNRARGGGEGRNQLNKRSDTKTTQRLEIDYDGTRNLG